MLSRNYEGNRSIQTNSNVNLSISKIEWGIKRESNHKQPDLGKRNRELIEKYNGLAMGNSENKYIYLTFDLGYEAGYTENILNTLKDNNVKAAFFVTNHYINTASELIKRMIDEGHIVGNHTMTHPDMSKISDKKSFSEELSGLEKLYKDITGQDMMKFYRPPQGKFSVDNLKMASEMGYKTVFWSLAYVDWYNDDQPTKEEAFEKLIPRIHNGAVVLLHSTSETNSKILDELLTKWEEMGYEFGTISELI